MGLWGRKCLLLIGYSRLEYDSIGGKVFYKSHIDGLLAVVGRSGTSVGIAILDLSLSGHHRMQVVCFDKGLSELVYDGLLVSRCMLWAGTVPTSVPVGKALFWSGVIPARVGCQGTIWTWPPASLRWMIHALSCKERQ